MPAITPEILASLQGNNKNIRNICILAHVDHGKTTLSDRLISSNGIISNNLAGKIRYLDVRPDEIERRITMKSSCISLLHKDRKASDSDDKKNQYLIHLIDSPGHVDFSSEVSTAVRLSDGGIVVVDVLEGVCVQTEAVLKQAWNEKLKVTLLLNKVDRLITELQMTPMEASERINRVLEQVNAVTGRLFSVSAFKALEEKKEDSGADTEEATEVDWESVMKTEENVYFSPDKGNVCFGSALDGWGFSIETFVDIWVKKLGVKREILQKTLWGEFYFNPKTKKIHTKNFNGKMIPMFVQFVLNSIWEVYSAAKTDKTKLEKIVNTLQIKANVHKFQNETPTAIANAILSKWLPIQDSVLQMVAEKLPSPQEAQKVRVPKIWQPPIGTNDQMKAKLKELETAMLECDPNSPEVVLFVSKIFPLPRDSFTGNIMSSKTIAVPKARENVNMEIQPQAQVSSKEEETSVKDSEKPQEKAPEKPAPVAFRPKHEGEKFVAFARIFCGTLRRGAKVHVLGPRYIPSEPTKHHSVAEIEDLYMLMGREVESIPEVSAGNIFGIGGLEDYIIKTATVTTTPDCSTFSPMAILSSPIVRVAVEPENPTEKNKLVEGLKLLNQADPVVEIYIQETGEHVIVAAGELHLERCLRDLRENYARIKIQVSPPLVAFRETITDQSSVRFAKQVKEYVQTANKLGKVKVKAVPLPENIMKFIRANAPMIRRVFVEESVNLQENADIEAFRTQLEQEFKNAGHKWEKELEFLWSFGPRRIGPNILLNHIPGFCTDSPWVSASKKMKRDYQPQLKSKVSKKDEQKVTPSKHLDIFDEDAASEKSEEENESEIGRLISSEEKIKKLIELENSIINGFQLATASGPLCEEPMMGVCFMVEEVEIRERDAEKADTTGPFNGQIMSATKEACRAAFLQKSARLMEPMYSCEIQIPSDFMGKCYTVLGRRRAKILNEEVKEGGMFQIQSLLPVAESFGLSVEMLTQTSGSASVQLLFHNWELLDEDPFWEARTEEELEDIGANVGGIAPNVARKYMDEVRKRKGLRVEEQIVKFADKQRTLKKNK